MTSNSRLTDLVVRLMPYDIAGLTKVRLGRNNDGGYVVPRELISSTTHIVSCGVGADSSFEDAYLRCNGSCTAMLLDSRGSCSIPKSFADRVRFKTVVLNRGNNVKQFLGKSGVLLKMDIESGEYEALYDNSGSFVGLSGVSVFVVELHDILWNDRAVRLLDDIEREMTLFHVHGNAYGGVVQTELGPVPNVVELTFVANHLATDSVPSKSRYPVAGLDQCNKPGCADLDLGFLEKSVSICHGMPVNTRSIVSQSTYVRMWDRFDMIIALSYTGYKDRQPVLQAEFERVGLSGRVELFWNYPSPFDMRFANSIRLHQTIGKPSHFNEVMGHYRAMKTAFELGVQHVLILEDDVRFVSDLDLLSRSLASIPDDYDVAKLEWFCKGDPAKVSGSGGWAPLRGFDTRGGAAIAYSRAGLQWKTTAMERPARYDDFHGMLFVNDVYETSSNLSRLHAYVATPLVAIQDPAYYKTSNYGIFTQNPYGKFLLDGDYSCYGGAK